MWRFRGSPHYIDQQGDRLGVSKILTDRARHNQEMYRVSVLVGQLCERYHRTPKDGGLRDRVSGRTGADPGHARPVRARIGETPRPGGRRPGDRRRGPPGLRARPPGASFPGPLRLRRPAGARQTSSPIKAHRRPRTRNRNTRRQIMAYITPSRQRARRSPSSRRVVRQGHLENLIAANLNGTAAPGAADALGTGGHRRSARGGHVLPQDHRDQWHRRDHGEPRGLVHGHRGPDPEGHIPDAPGRQHGPQRVSRDGQRQREVLYASGITAGTYSLSVAVPSNSFAVPVRRRTPRG